MSARYRIDGSDETHELTDDTPQTVYQALLHGRARVVLDDAIPIDGPDSEASATR